LTNYVKKRIEDDQNVEIVLLLKILQILSSARSDFLLDSEIKLTFAVVD
jgi:hypothetical protein